VKLDELLNEKQINELGPLAPLGYAAGKAAAAAIAKKALVKGSLFNKIRQWTSKAPPDSSIPPALQTDKEGYGKGQVDPPLARAARKAHAPKKTATPPQVAKKQTSVGPMSKLQRATT
jgi:hypothetical protein